MQTNQPTPTSIPPTSNLQPTNTPPTTQTPTQPSSPKKKTPWLLISLVVLLLGATGAFAYKYYQVKQQLDNQKPTLLPSPQLVVSSPSSITSPAPEVDPTANWKTYTNSIRKYLIKYPPNWVIDTSKAETSLDNIQGAELLIFQGEYNIKILWPSAFGPGICIFDDQSRVGAPEMASYCEGKYVEFKNQSQSTHRRLINPKADVPEAEIFYDHAEWEIYTQENNNQYFVTVPPIRYTAPLQYQQNNIKIMDQVLATYKSLN